MEAPTAVGWSTPTTTPSLGTGRIVFTTGSTIVIDAPAKEVFNIMVYFRRYSEWNSWTPRLTVIGTEVPEALEPGDRGALGTLTYGGEDMMKIPIEILALNYGEQECKLAWKSNYLPWWAATIERVQTVTAKGPDTCEVKNWESMGGLAAYAMKLSWVSKQLETSNARYLEELAAFVKGRVTKKSGSTKAC
ncbi:start-like domain-containing protein [Fusarium coicis]|nr:start-like domain-containing protein [Fusarium coicis]